MKLEPEFSHAKDAEVAEERPSWLPKKTTILAGGAALAAIIKEVLGLDLGAHNVANFGVGAAGAVGGSWLAWKAGRAMWPIILVWLARRRAGK